MSAYPTGDLLPEQVVGKHYYTNGNGGVKIHFIRKGQGTPVLLLHGWPGFWYDWRHIIGALAESADVIAPDFRGFGDSDKPDISPVEGYTPEHLAKDVIALLDELGKKQAIVVAHDIGATIAQFLAKNYPEYVKALVLLNPPYNGIGTRRFDPSIQGAFWYQHFHNLDWAGDLIGYNEETVKLYLTHFYQAWTGNKAALRENELAAIINAYGRDDAMKKSIYYYKARAQAKKPTAKQSTAEKINQPTTVLWGKEDPVILADWSDRLGEFFEDYTLKILPGIGHFVPFEAPEDVVTAIKRHLYVIQGYFV
jgi:pimeloyl-ACP methyl ester carboxylesterase